MTLNGHWGYFLGDENWKPAATVIRNLVDIVSKGGNYLLNVGPTGQGIIPPGAVHDLQEVGAWMKANGEAIYGTTPGSLKTVNRLGAGSRTRATSATCMFLTGRRMENCRWRDCRAHCRACPRTCWRNRKHRS